MDTARQWAAIGQCLALAVVGGYFLSAAMVALLALGFSRIMPRSEAVMLMATCVYAALHCACWSVFYCSHRWCLRCCVMAELRRFALGDHDQSCRSRCRFHLESMASPVAPANDAGEGGQ